MRQSRRDYAPAEVLKSPPFWLMYAMFVMVGTGGLMADGAARAHRQGLRVDNVPVSILGLTLPALSFALSIDRVLNGVSPAVLRLGVRPYRPREHDAHRLPVRRHRHLTRCSCSRTVR